MSLSKQLMILLFTLVVLLLLGTFMISVNNSRAYLESQLGSHAQDAATSLGLSATTHMASEDKAMVDAMVNAMFDRGDYLSIRLQSLDGNAWVERIGGLGIDGVPAWFVRLFALRPPQRSATMMAGWRQVGEVLVVSHPELAYRQLWDNAVQTLRLFLAGSVFALLASLLVLRWMLQPLRLLEWQAKAICNREFPVVERRPFTSEFRRVVEAMNRLSGRVARMLADSERIAADLREQAFKDPVTGLANRRQFMDVLEHLIQDPESLLTGGLLLLELKDFKAYNQTHGYAAGDQLLRATGTALEGVMPDDARITLAHLAGADFAILLDGGDEDMLRELAAQVAGAVAGLYGQMDLPTPDVAHVGGVCYAAQSATALLAEADQALREAQRAGANAWVVCARSPSSQVRSRSQWRDLILDALTERRFTLMRQPVVGCAQRELLHHEVFLRLEDPDQIGQQISAAVFMPMAESEGLTATLDKAVLAAVLEGLDQGLYPGAVAVNLGTPSLRDRELLTWIQAETRLHPDSAHRLILEVPEYGASACSEQLLDWMDRLVPMGVRFSLDHFGKGFASFAYLRSLKVHYLKVDGSFVRNLDHQESNRFFLRAIAEIGHGLDICVVAESVETEADWRVVQGMAIDGGRGYWLGLPEPF